MVVDMVGGWVRSLHHTFIQAPLRELYFNGPESLGFWDGIEFADICFSLTNTSSTFWLEHLGECVEMCDKKFGAFNTVVNFVIYVVILFRVVNGVMFHFCFTRPFIAEFRRLRTHETKKLN
jgi:hypothetical protein